MNSKVIGSTLIIAGTTIGAGMLALPLASAGIGFIPSLTIMIALWAMMAYTALLMIELHQHASPKATLHTIATQILGTKGKWIASIAMLFLFYALCAAYIAGGGGQFTERLESLANIKLDQAWGTTLFTVVIALTVTIGTHAVDKLNRVLFTVKLLAMASVLFVLAPSVSQPNLLSMPIQQGLIVASIPVIFTSFGFHGSIPAIVNYLDGDTRSLRKAIIIGSSIPLGIYVLWQIVTLGVVPQQHMIDSAGLSSLISLLSNTVHKQHLSNVIGVFADLALVTSFLGVSLGLFEFLKDLTKRKSTLNEDSEVSLSFSTRVVAALITFIPPLCFALFYPQGFIMALGYAAIALAVLAVFLPTIMVRKVRKQHLEGQYYQVKGGTTALVTIFTLGGLIVTAQLLITFNFLPSLG
jgi:tyrosine-specific transport protein